MGRGPAYFWNSALRPCNGPVRWHRERGELIDVCVSEGKMELVGGEQLVGFF